MKLKLWIKLNTFSSNRLQLTIYAKLDYEDFGLVVQPFLSKGKADLFPVEFLSNHGDAAVHVSHNSDTQVNSESSKIQLRRETKCIIMNFTQRSQWSAWHHDIMLSIIFNM